MTLIEAAREILWENHCLPAKHAQETEDGDVVVFGFYLLPRRARVPLWVVIDAAVGERDHRTRERLGNAVLLKKERMKWRLAGRPVPASIERAVARLKEG